MSMRPMQLELVMCRRRRFLPLSAFPIVREEQMGPEDR